MKKIKFAFLLAFLIVICFSFIACNDMATLELRNDTNVSQSYAIRINGEWQDGSALSVTMSRGGIRSWSKSGGIEYVVYRSRLNTAGWYIWIGSVSPGETVTLRFSEAER